MRIAIAVAVLLMLSGAVFADVNNVNLGSVQNSGISGTATTITGTYGGVTPHTHLELNARMNQLPPSDSVYQAWLIDNQSNARQSLGVFEGNFLSADMTFTAFSDTGPWDAVAVSVEPANDMNPLPDRIVALGNLPGNDVASNDFDRVAILPPDESLQRQFAMQRFNMTNQQVMALRMQGLTYRDINLVGNIAAQCDRSLQQVAQEYMQSGANLAQLASTCNTTVASLLTPAPGIAIAGARQELVPGTSMMVPNFYLTRPNGARVITYTQWQRFRNSGYSWREVAVAANISQRTGERVGDILQMTRVQGMTFAQIAMDRNIDPDDVMDVSAWPWERDGTETVIIVTPQGTMTTPPGTSTNVPNY